MKTTIIFLAFIFFYSSINAQHNFNLDKESILVKKQSNIGLVYNHNLSKGETLYGLASYFNISLKDLLQINDIKDVSSLDIGQEIAIPFDSKILERRPSISDSEVNFFVPVYYNVGAKENLYRISKFYFDQSIDAMMLRNNLSNHDLELGKTLLVGWLKSGNDIADNTRERILQPEKISDNLILVDTISLYIKNELFSTNEDLTKEKRILKSAKEIAIWDKSAPKTGNMFALHNHAKKNTIIEIYNPLLNRTAYATVIGSIPRDSYTDDVTLIISPKVAGALGALDKRFMVETKYYK